MAVVQYSALVDQMRGNLNGTVLSKYLGGYSAYKKGQPSRTGTEKQQIRRQQLSNSARLWNLMAPQGRIDWSYIAANTTVKNRLGEDVHLSGFNYWMKFAQLEQMMGFEPNEEPETTLAQPYAWNITSNTLDVTIIGRHYVITSLHVGFEVTAETTTRTYEAIYISLPVPRDDSNYDNTYYFVGSGNRAAGSGIGATWSRSFSDITMPEGWYTYPGAYHHIIAKPLALFTGQEGPTATTVRLVDFTPPLPPYWPISFIFPSPGSNSAVPLERAGDKMAFYSASFWLTTSIALTDTESDYTIEMQAPNTTYATPETGPSYFTGSEPLWSGAPNLILGPGFTEMQPLSAAAWSTYSDVELSLTDAQVDSYLPVRFRIKTNSDGLWSQWQYSTIYINPYP